MTHPDLWGLLMDSFWSQHLKLNVFTPGIDANLKRTEFSQREHFCGTVWPQVTNMVAQPCCGKNTTAPFHSPPLHQLQ